MKVDTDIVSDVARSASLPAASSARDASFDPARVRADFPILHTTAHGRPLVYLDNAATSQKPSCVIDAEAGYYAMHNANVHRGVHVLSEQATAAYEHARDAAQAFLNARRRDEIVFVRGATEGINLVAASLGQRLRAGDEIVLTEMEHHSNIVPWQLLAQRTGAALRIAPIDEAGELIVEQYERLLGSRTRIVALAHVSNALGTVNPVRTLTRLAHEVNAWVLLDGAQAAPHLRIDVQELDCDFYALSGHKMYGPTGIGILYGKAEVLHDMPPYQGGGDMIRHVSFRQTTFQEAPYRFEAGTPNIAGAVGLATAIDYLNHLGRESVADYEAHLLEDAMSAAREVPGVRLIGQARERAGVLSFVLQGVHAHDVGTILDHEGVAVRAGHHCAMPVMERFQVPATVRASFALYNNHAEVEALWRAVRRARELFQ